MNDSENVTVSYDLSSGRIIAYIPPCKDDTGEDIAATTFDLSPAEAVELAGGITAAAVSAAQHLLQQRTTTLPARSAPGYPGMFGLCAQQQRLGDHICTLLDGHAGDHVAERPGSSVPFARWSR